MGHISRRQFVKSGTAAGMLAAGPAASFGQAPTVSTPRSVKPVVVASANGHKYRNGGPRTAVQEAFDRIVKGEDVLDALVAGVNICELDPEDDSVGYGGLPNADGVVQLDASCMHGPRKRAGGVAGLEGVRTPSNVAKAVLDLTDHHLLVGRGAQELARQLGFRIEEDLNTDNSRRKWLEWRRRIDPEHWLDPVKRSHVGLRVWRQMIAEGLVDSEHAYGTINCNGITPKGEIAGTTTTSGLAWKIPGRVGDSPILGAGLYVDGDVGAAGSTGRGEANLYALSSYLVVEEMRRGAHPRDAALAALRRIKANTIEPRLLDAAGNPDFNVAFYVLNRKGEYAGVSLWEQADVGERKQYAVCTEAGPQLLPCDFLLPGRPQPKPRPAVPAAP
jgi:N4-(beta-N-acetylglucosaminyl)-L-asparaginase